MGFRDVVPLSAGVLAGAIDAERRGDPRAEGPAAAAARGAGGNDRFSYDDLRSLEQGFERSLRHLRFEVGVESIYRDWNRARFRASRGGLFLVLAALFFMAPLYLSAIFDISDGLHDLFVTLDVLVVGPVLACAAFATWTNRVQALTQAVQTAAILAMLAVTLLAHVATVHGDPSLSKQLLAFELIATAYFGGFSWTRIVVASALFLPLQVVVDLQVGNHWEHWPSTLFAAFCAGAISVLGAYNQERIARVSWIRRKMTEVLLRTDVLTGLTSRFEFDRAFARILRQARRDQKLVGVLLLDVDHFKRINDTQGHLIGDQVLGEVGRAVRRSAGRRALDLQARFGGEEMVVVWYDADVGQLPRMAEQVLESVRQVQLTCAHTSRPLPVTVSGGLTWAIPGEASGPEALLRHADELMYQAKHGGRNRTVSAAFAA
jgi:diguanylate cyclase (GGDEF)-like protein